MSANAEPFISVILAVLNGEKTIKRFLDSYTNQTYQDKELIIIDGGSIDGTLDILRSYSNVIDYWHSEFDKGIYHAWNKGLSCAKGSWISFVGSDDFFIEESALEKFAAHLHDVAENIKLVYCRGAIVDEQGEIIDYRGKEWNRERFIKEMIIFHPGAMHRRSIFNSHGLFDESLRISGDYEFLLRELKNKDALFLPDLVCVAAQRSGTSVMLSNRLKVYKEAIYSFNKNKIKIKKTSKLSMFLRASLQYLLWRIMGDHCSRRFADIYRKIIGQNKYWYYL